MTQQRLIGLQGVRQLFGFPLRRALQAHDLIPDPKSVRTFPTILCRLETVAARTKVFADRPESRQEALGMARRLEVPHRSLTLPRWLVRVFRSLVQPPVAPMLNAGHDLLLGRLIDPELVRDQHPGDVLAALQQFAEELLGRGFVSSALHQDIKHIPILIDGPPQIRYCHINWWLLDTAGTYAILSA